MDTLTEDRDTLLAQLYRHLADVEKEPETNILDPELLKRVERSLDATTPRTVAWDLLQKGELLLLDLKQEPKPLTRLLEHVILFIPFDELKTSISAAKLEEGLASPSVAVQLLCLAYLRKAAGTPSGASFVAASSSLVKCLVTIWLSSESTEVAERSLEVIIALLAVDRLSSITVVTTKDAQGEAQGHGLLWRRLFHDGEVYSLFYEWTSMVGAKHDTMTKKGLQMATISQARLFDFLVRLAELDLAVITTSTLPKIEKRYQKDKGVDRPYGGLLRYAALNMIDQSDILMAVLRQDFFVNLLNVIDEPKAQIKSSPRLLTAIKEDAGIDETGQDSMEGLHL